MRFKTFFYGGAELNGNKERTMQAAVANAALPNVAIIPMLQHAGPEADPLVEVGDAVREQMCIARTPSGDVSIHSPIPGVVREFRDVNRPDGRISRAIVVEMAGSFDHTGRQLRAHAWDQLDPEALLDTVRDMGVVGLGRDSIPTHLKLRHRRLQAEGPRASHLIVNAMESDPYLTGHFRCLVEKTAEVVEGIRIIQHILGGPPAIVALNADYRAAVPLLRKAATPASSGLTIQALAPIVPQGDDRLLSQTLLRVDQPLTGPDKGGNVVVLDVATVYAVYEAVVYRKPLTERIVTIAGDAVRQAMNLRVRIGTPISWLLEECGGLRYLPDRIVVGGPLTGKTIIDPDTPVTKETQAILALGRREINYGPRRDCLRCGSCVRICPAGLEPIKLAKLIRQGLLEEARENDLELCSDCGLCAFACPSRVPLTQVLREGRLKVVAYR